MMSPKAGQSSKRCVVSTVAARHSLGRWVQEQAKQNGFATAEVQISETETPLHKLETVYRRAMEQLSTADCFLEHSDRSSMVGSTGWKKTFWQKARLIPTILKRSPRNLMSCLNNGSLKSHERLLSFPPHCARTEPLNVPMIMPRQKVLAGWLAGQPHISASVKRTAGVKGDVDHFAALSFLRGLLLILKDSGYSGLVLVLDEIETIQRVRSDVREKGLNALRQLLDDVDGGRFPNLYLAITGTPAFYDGPQGIQRLEPLAQRLHVDFRRMPVSTILGPCSCD